MLTPEQKRSIPTELVALYEELGEYILRDIASRIAEGVKITETAEFQLYRARSLGLCAKEIAAKIAQISGLSAEVVEKLMRSAAEQSDEYDKRMLGADDHKSIPLEENEQLQKLIAAQIKETNGRCENLTNTLGFADHDFMGRVYYLSLTDMYRRELDAAHMKVVTGAADYTTAIRQAVNKLAASGVRTIDYESGASRSVEAAVRTALMTSVSHIAHSISEQNGKEFGADGWEMSAHSGARPSHAVYQGRQYTQKEYEQKIKPLLSEPNCRHDVYPIILGVSKPVYTDEELENIDPPPFTYEGRRYTAYEAQQQMRKMERAMRKQKNRCIVAEAAGDKEGFTTASIKLRRQKDIYEDFCRKAGSFTQYERTIVGGYDRHLSGKTGAVTRKQRAFEKAQMKLDSNIEKVYNYMGDDHLFAAHFADGKLDLKSARKEYDSFLNSSVPKSHMKLLKQYSYGARFVETDNQSITMGYAASKDVFVYNPRNTQLANYDLNMSLTHEIAHRIDNKVFHSDKHQAFLTAISQYGDSLDYKGIAEAINTSEALVNNAPLQDIFSAVSEGGIPLRAGHDAQYWQKSGKKPKEIFANLFTLECFCDTEGLDFVKNVLPDVYNAYVSMTTEP